VNGLKNELKKIIVKRMSIEEITLMIGFLDDCKKARLKLKDAILILRECRDDVEKGKCQI
jgi:hypothetical protein